MSQPAADFDPFATAPEPEPEPAQPLASLIRAYFAPEPDHPLAGEEMDAYYQSLDELHEEITERLAGKEGRIMDAAFRLLPSTEAEALALRTMFNRLHRLMLEQPFKMGYQISPGGILNAYREGDVSFEDAAAHLERMIAEGPDPDRDDLNPYLP